MELQGVCLVVLSFFRDAEAAAALADTVAAHDGVLGAAVCCAEDGGKPEDDWTTCEADRDMLLDRCVNVSALSSTKTTTVPTLYLNVAAPPIDMVPMTC